MTLQNDSLRLLRHLSELRFEEELRGYSKSQVDRVLQKLSPMAGEIETLQSRLSEAETRAAAAEARLMERSDDGGQASPPPPPPAGAEFASSDVEMPATPADFDETLRKTLVLAQRTADETVKEAYDEAERVTNNAHGEADLVVSKARTEAEQLQADAESRHDEMISGAEAERDRLLDEATAAAEAKKAELESALNEAEGSERAELLEQIANLQEIRDLLTADIETLENHLAGRRSVIQAALSELTRAIDDPASMQPAVAPELSEVAPVSADEYDSVSLAIPGLEESERLDSGDERLRDEEQQDAEARDTGRNDSEDSLSGDESDVGDPSDAVADQMAEVDTALSPAEVAEADDAAGSSGNDASEEDLVDTDAGPAPDAAGPATQEFSFSELAEHEAELADEADGDVLPGTNAITDDGGAVADSGVVSAVASDPWAVEASLTNDSSPSRPAWVDAVPETSSPQPVSQDPFLEELRRATSDDTVDSDEALDRFLDGDEEDERKSWFGRRSR